MNEVIRSSTLLTWLLAAAGVLSLLVYGLFGLYRQSAPARMGGIRSLELDAEQLGGFSYSRLALISVLTVLLKAPLSPLHQALAALPQMLGGGTEVNAFGVPSLPTSWTGTLLALAVMVLLFAVIAMIFVPAGQLVGWYLEKASME